MKTLLILCAFIPVCFGAAAQSFTEDFESYTQGAYLAESNPKWTTWTTKPGTDEDVRITGDKSHSGLNSIYLSSVYGGPAAPMLPLGAELKTGTVTLSTWLYVDTDKAAYINIQAKTGKLASLEVFFKKDGGIEVQNGDETYHSGMYKQGEWFSLKLEIDLNTNTWELLIDDVSQAVFSNRMMQVAGLLFYPNEGSSFYVDDVSYSYSPGPVKNLDLSVVKISNLTGAAGITIQPTVVVRNLGNTIVSSFGVSFSYNGSSFSRNITGKNLKFLDTFSVILDPVVLAGGKHQAEASIKAVNGQMDEDTANNKKRIEIDPVIPFPGKMVIVEEATGTWCGWCPRGTVYMDKMTKKYPGLFQGIAVHNGDPMVVTFYDEAVAQRIKGWPSILVDRQPEVDPLVIENEVLKRLTIAPKAAMIPGALLDDFTHTLKVSLTTTLKQNVNGPFRIACIITEDRVSGKNSEYSQANYYSGGARGPMGGFEKMGNPVNYRFINYDHVARAISPGFNGYEIFDGERPAGTSFTHTFTFDMTGFNTDSVHIIGIIIGPDGLIDNGCGATIQQAAGLGYKEGTQVSGINNNDYPTQITAYPNPTRGMVTINGLLSESQAEVFDISGKQVFVKSNVKPSQQLNLEELQDGIYFLKVISSEGIFTTKLVLIK